MNRFNHQRRSQGLECVRFKQFLLQFYIMPDLKLINAFRINGIRIVQLNGKLRLQPHNEHFAFLVSWGVCLVTIYCGYTEVFSRVNFYMETTVETAGFIRYNVITFSVLASSVLFLLKRNNIQEIIENLICFDEECTNITNNCKMPMKLRWTEIQLVFVCSTYTIILVSRLVWFTTTYVQAGFYRTITLVLMVFVEFLMRTQHIFIQLFAENMARRYQLLRLLLNNNRCSLVTIVKFYGNLCTIHRLAADAFGIQCILLVLTSFVSCAMNCYLSIWLVQESRSLTKILMESIYLVPLVSLFFGFTYQFERLVQEVSYQVVNTPNQLCKLFSEP